MSDLALFPASAMVTTRAMFFFWGVSVHQPFWFHSIRGLFRLIFAVSEVVFSVAALHRFEGKKGNWKMLMCRNQSVKTEVRNLSTEVELRK